MNFLCFLTIAKKKKKKHLKYEVIENSKYQLIAQVLLKYFENM